MTLLRIDASIRFEGSVSRELADIAEQAWTAEHRGDEVVRRDLGRDPLPAGLWPAIVSGRGVPEAQHTDEQRAATAVAAGLVDELATADAIIVATPLYNFGVSQHLKTWIDLVMTDPRLLSGGDLVSGRPLILALARGGGYGTGTPREGWDHATPWLERIFRDVWGADLRLATAELTLADVTPQMEPLRGLAAESRELARRTALEHGTAVARELSCPAA